MDIISFVAAQSTAVFYSKNLPKTSPTLRRQISHVEGATPRPLAAFLTYFGYFLTINVHLISWRAENWLFLNFVINGLPVYLLYCYRILYFGSTSSTHTKLGICLRKMNFVLTV